MSSAIAQLTLVTDESEYTLRASGTGLTISTRGRAIVIAWDDLNAVVRAAGILAVGGGDLDGEMDLGQATLTSTPPTSDETGDTQ